MLIVFYSFNIVLVHSTAIVRTKTNEERIRHESDLKRVYIYASRAIQTQEQTNLNRYALVKGNHVCFLYRTLSIVSDAFSCIGTIRSTCNIIHRVYL
jgi:hypothetical protein